MSPIRFDLELDLDAASDELSGRVRIDAVASERVQTIWLNARGPSISQATVTANGKRWVATAIPYPDDEMLGLLLPRAVGPGPVRIDIAYVAPVSSTDVSRRVSPARPRQPLPLHSV